MLDQLEQTRIQSIVNPFYKIYVENCVDSTNDQLKLYQAQLKEGTVLIAEQQTKGKGRNARSFHSPSGNGLYFSFLLRPHLKAEQALKICALASVAVHDAIYNCYGIHAKIKWVNDLLIQDKKITGILCESIYNQTYIDAMIVGIGINVHSYEMPDELKNIAGCIEDFSEKIVSRNDLVAEVLNCFYKYYQNLEKACFMDVYRQYSYVLNKEIVVDQQDHKFDCIAVDINDDGQLIVKKGEECIALTTGDIHIQRKGL